MKDIVIIPTFYRPEYLALCLEHLQAAQGDRDILYYIVHDRHISDRQPDVEAQLLPDTHNVVTSFRLLGDHPLRSGLPVVFHERIPHGYNGNGLNFLEAYRAAFFTPDVRYVYMVEDDVFVGPDFFRWHEAVQARRRDYFCTVGWHCIRNPKVLPSQDPTAIIETNQDYSSIGVCWRRERLASVVEHANPAYYSDPAGYLKKTFPQSTLPLVWSEQAGLIMRVLLQDSTNLVAWAALPRCAHVGINGYHRKDGHKFAGTLEERIEALREAAKDTKHIVGLSKTVFDDIASLPPVPEWREADIHVVQEFK